MVDEAADGRLLWASTPSSRWPYFGRILSTDFERCIFTVVGGIIANLFGRMLSTNFDPYFFVTCFINHGNIIVGFSGRGWSTDFRL